MIQSIFLYPRAGQYIDIVSISWCETVYRLRFLDTAIFWYTDRRCLFLFLLRLHFSRLMPSFKLARLLYPVRWLFIRNVIQGAPRELSWLLTNGSVLHAIPPLSHPVSCHSSANRSNKAMKKAKIIISKISFSIMGQKTLWYLILSTLPGSNITKQ